MAGVSGSASLKTRWINNRRPTLHDSNQDKPAANLQPVILMSTLDQLTLIVSGQERNELPSYNFDAAQYLN